MANPPLARHLLRAKDLVDGRYFEPLTVPDLAAAAVRCSRWQLSTMRRA